MCFPPYEGEFMKKDIFSSLTRNSKKVTEFKNSIEGNLKLQKILLTVAKMML